MRIINATPHIYGGEESPENSLSAAPGSIYICECGDVWIKAGSLSTGTEGWLQIREGVPTDPPLLRVEGGGEAPVEEAEEETEPETAEDLVSRNNKDELLQLVEDEDVEGVDENNTKAEIAEAIVAKRNG